MAVVFLVCPFSCSSVRVFLGSLPPARGCAGNTVLPGEDMVDPEKTELKQLHCPRCYAVGIGRNERDSGTHLAVWGVTP